MNNSFAKYTLEWYYATDDCSLEQTILRLDNESFCEIVEKSHFNHLRQRLFIQIFSAFSMEKFTEQRFHAVHTFNVITCVAQSMCFAPEEFCCHMRGYTMAGYM